MAKVSLRAYNREIETMIDRGQLDEAIAHCHHILKTFPKHLETYRLLGKAYLESKRYGDAVDIFSRVLASVPNDFVSQVGMSIIRDEENKLDDAIWHMERAFETQPSNSAIQSELQRLYGRRDGVQPPRIRMTRGALAHMYVQGELYPQAISEIRSVLKEDPGRSDMQALLARASFKSGAKNDAVDAALALLQRHPYSLDANRVLVEVLGADRNENAQAYRQRLVELDPYAAQVTSSVFQSNEVPDAAVSVERLDWNGQPMGIQPDWRDTTAISLEGGASRTEQPDWLKGPFGEATPSTPAQPTSVPAFDMSSSAPATPAQPADEIPDFLKAAGWGQSTGAFDESKSSLFSDAEPAAQPIEQGDLPDWVKAMKPSEPEPAQEPEEELPDWINKIGTGALSASTPEKSEQSAQPFPVPSNDQPDWLKGFGEPEQAEQASQDQPDWLKGFASESELTPQSPQTDAPDWLKGLGSEPGVAPTEQAGESDWLKSLESQTDLSSQPAPTESPDWLKGLGSEPEPAASQQIDDSEWLKSLETPSDFTPQPAETETPDWLKGLAAESEPAAAQEADNADWLKSLESPSEFTPQPAQTETPEWLQNLGTEPETAATEQQDNTDWLKQFGTEADSAATPTSNAGEFDFLNELTEEPILQNTADATPSSSNLDDLGKSEQERDDSFAWLESLAAKQGASEGLLTTPEERLEDEPDWVKQAKGISNEPAVSQPSSNLEEVGQMQQERDDSFAWLENLTSDESANESFLTTPEERLEGEPESVEQAKDLTSEPTAPQAVANAEELGKSEQERDDSFAWLESLAAKQGASEGLLTKPEDRLEEEPDWVKQAKGLPTMSSASQPPANLEELGKSEEERDDSFAWLESLAAKQGASEGLLTTPEERLEEEPEWVKQAKSLNAQPTPTPEPAASTEQPSSMDDTAAWLRSLEEEEKPVEAPRAADETAMWLKSLDEAQPVPVQPPESLDVDMPAWMNNIEPEETSAMETPVPVEELPKESAPEPVSFAETKSEESGLPSWLSELDQEEQVATPSDQEDLPAWLRGDDSATTTPEPTQATDWKPVEEKQPEITYSPEPEEPKRAEIVYSPPLAETKEPEPEAPLPVASLEEPQETVVQQREERTVEPQPLQEEPKPKPEPVLMRQMPAKQTPSAEPVSRSGAGMQAMSGVDQVLGLARNELSRSNIPGAMESYAKLIKKGRFLDEVIHDLREALYRYPVEVGIWQSLGDAYMRANRLQDALDAYTKAEELLR